MSFLHTSIIVSAGGEGLSLLWQQKHEIGWLAFSVKLGLCLYCTSSNSLLTKLSRSALLDLLKKSTDFPLSKVRCLINSSNCSNKKSYMYKLASRTLFVISGRKPLSCPNQFICDNKGLLRKNWINPKLISSSLH